MFGVYIAGGISGGHLNPAVTLANCLYRRFVSRSSLTSGNVSNLSSPGRSSCLMLLPKFLEDFVGQPWYMAITNPLSIMLKVVTFGLI